MRQKCNYGKYLIFYKLSFKVLAEFCFDEQVLSNYLSFQLLSSKITELYCIEWYLVLVKQIVECFYFRATKMLMDS